MARVKKAKGMGNKSITKKYKDIAMEIAWML